MSNVPRDVNRPPDRELPVHLSFPRRLSSLLPFTLACSLVATGCGEPKPTPVDPLPVTKALVVGHRGASALRPEHTLESYRKAVEDGADIIEPDLVSTKDGVLVARHENEISGTTNVADVAKFASRKTTKMVDTTSLTGWFTEDFTLAELKELRAKERIPAVRPGNTQYDGKYEVPTFAEVIALAKQLSQSSGRTIHIYPETKHPTYFQGINLPLEDKVLEELNRDAFTRDTATVYIQSFEVANLKYFHSKIGTSHANWKLVQLMEEATLRPYDFTKAKDTRTYGDLMTAEGMREIATYANGVGPYKRSIIDVDATTGAFLAPSTLVANAHAAQLTVHPYTFRPENNFLTAPYKAPGDATVRSVDGAIKEIHTYLDAGIDGFFTDDPAVGRQAVDSYRK